MRKTVNRLTCIALFIFFAASPAGAESEYLEDWIGTWTVTMKDATTVTWDITHTWVSDTGKSHLAYGTTDPGNVEFQIYFGTMFMKHYYIEVSHDMTVYDLPMDFSQYTELIPDDDFETFTGGAGTYPIESGYRGTVPPEPELCAASYLLGPDNPGLDTLRQLRDEYMAGSEAGRTMITVYYDRSDDIIEICEKSPAVKWFLIRTLEGVLSD